MQEIFTTILELFCCSRFYQYLTCKSDLYHPVYLSSAHHGQVNLTHNYDKTFTVTLSRVGRYCSSLRVYNLHVSPVQISAILLQTTNHSHKPSVHLPTRYHPAASGHTAVCDTRPDRSIRPIPFLDSVYAHAQARRNEE